MDLLILGIIIFFTIHLVPISPLKNILINLLGENKYKGLFSLIALVGLLIIIYGYSIADFYLIWEPLSYSREIALVLMPISIVLLASANMQTNIKRFIKHPMLIGILVWSFVHLLANGDLRSIILFASFGVYALIDIMYSKKVLTTNNITNYTLTKDMIIVIIGLVAYTLIVHFHQYIAGVDIF
jgi:uncharacterized membrane protein|tara:strand:+ start:626 stop:1177 length:552 start_codon:yes stop_codon:yes gene_type:complete